MALYDMYDSATGALLRTFDYAGDPETGEAAPPDIPHKNRAFIAHVTPAGVDRRYHHVVWDASIPGRVKRDRDLAEVQAAAVARVNAAAESVRGQYLTGGQGQAMTYDAKAQEAAAYQAASDPVDGGYPFLAAEAAALGWTLQAVAERVAATRTLWVQIGAEIEGTRQGALAGIAAAENVDAVALAEAFTWPTPDN